MTVFGRRSPSQSLTVVRPFYRPTSLLDDVEAMAREAWESWAPVSYGYGTSLTPRVDMIEDKDALVIWAEFPGLMRQDIDINLKGDVLTIWAEKKREAVSEEVTSYYSERCFGHYSRSISLPFPVDADKLSATFKNGLLEIRLPKTAEAKGKHINVKAAISK